MNTPNSFSHAKWKVETLYLLIEILRWNTQYIPMRNRKEWTIVIFNITNLKKSHRTLYIYNPSKTKKKISWMHRYSWDWLGRLADPFQWITYIPKWCSSHKCFHFSTQYKLYICDPVTMPYFAIRIKGQVSLVTLFFLNNHKAHCVSPGNFIEYLNSLNLLRT